VFANNNVSAQPPSTSTIAPKRQAINQASDRWRDEGLAAIWPCIL
jgi:hypothetical protein